MLNIGPPETRIRWARHQGKTPIEMSNRNSEMGNFIFLVTSHSNSTMITYSFFFLILSPKYRTKLTEKQVLTAQKCLNVRNVLGIVCIVRSCWNVYFVL